MFIYIFTKMIYTFWIKIYLQKWYKCAYDILLKLKNRYYVYIYFHLNDVYI